MARRRMAARLLWLGWLCWAAGAAGGYSYGEEEEYEAEFEHDSTVRALTTPEDLLLEEEEEMMSLADRLSAEPISPDQMTMLMHKYESADPDTKILIRTAVELEQTDAILRCAACEAALGEVQMMLMARLRKAAALDPEAAHWTSFWSEMIVEEKMATVEQVFTPHLCADRMRLYGLHAPTSTYVPVRMGQHSVPGVEPSGEVAAFLTNQCKFLEYAYKAPIVQKLGNDTHRIRRQIVARRGSGALPEQLPILWHSVRKELCDTVTRSKGACLEQAHPFSGSQDRSMPPRKPR